MEKSIVPDIPKFPPIPPVKSKPKIVCLCGSTRFGDAFREANLKETLDGNIVLSIGWVQHKKVAENLK